MNRHERRKAAAKCKQHRNAQRPLQNKSVVIPADLRADIAASIRGIEFSVSGGLSDGLCLYRAVIGLELLRLLDIPARLAIGGMVYRVGSDPHRDVVAFCGEDNVGRLSGDWGMLGHCWIESGEEFVDFSVGDWRGAQPDDVSVLGPVVWEIEPPDFFWLPRASVSPIRGQPTPELGRAYYTGWRGPPPISNLEEARAGIDWPLIASYFKKCGDYYGLKNRVLG